MVLTGHARRAAFCLALAVAAGSIPPALEGRLAELRAALALAALAPGVTAAGVRREPGTGRIVARDVRASGDGWSFSAARLSFAPPAAGAALAAEGPAVSADDLRLEGLRRVYRAPHVEVRGSTIAAADLASILDPSSATPAADRLARLTASAISAPTVTVEPRDARSRYAATLHDLSLTGVAAGRVGTLSARAVEVSDRAAPDAHMEVGTVRADGVDLGLALALGGTAGVDPGAPLRPVLADLSAESIAFRGGGATVDLDAVRSGAVRARAPSDGQRRALLLARVPRGSLDAAQREALGDALTQVLVGFAYDHLEASGLAIRTPPPAVGSVRLGRLAVDDLGEGRPLSILIERGETDFAGTRVSLARAAIANFDQTATAAAVKGLILDGAQTQPTVDFGARGLWPSFTMEGLAVSTPVKPGTGNDAGRARVVYDVSRASVAGGSAPDGTFASTAGLRLTMPMPDGAGEEPLSTLARLLPRLDAAADGAAAFDGAARRFRLDGFALRAAGLGDVTVRAVFDGVSPELTHAKPGDPAFDAELAAVALRSFAVEYVDHGLAAKALPILAAQSGVSVAAFKSSVEAQAEGAIADATGSPGLAARVAPAVRTFIADPRAIRLTVDAPAGVALGRMKEADSLADFLDGAALDVAADR